MADETTTDSTAQTTSDATAQNTDTQNSGAATGAVQQTQAQTTEKTFTQAEVNAMIAQRLPKAVKAELKKMSGESDGTPTVEELTRQLSERDTKLRTIEAREAVTDYLSDARHKLNVKPDNYRAIVKLVVPDLEYDDEGKPTNLKDAIENARSLAPALFANTPGSVDAAAGREGQTVNAGGMTGWVRRQAGIHTAN